MKKTLQVIKYIIQRNPWYEIPKRIFMAMVYQSYKRVNKGIFSKNLFNGKKILLFPNNPISSAFIYTRLPDYNEILSLRNFADENTIFIDVGANIGAYSLLLADKIKTAYAFEAHPVTAQYCKMNFMLNDIKESQVLALALGECVGQKYFTNLNGGDPTNTFTSYQPGCITVPTMTLDQFVHEQKFSQDQSYILKIDVEGFEHEVFRGAKTFLKEFNVKAILFEDFSNKSTEILSFLQELGYVIKSIGDHNMLATKLL